MHAEVVFAFGPSDQFVLILSFSVQIICRNAFLVKTFIYTKMIASLFKSIKLVTQGSVWALKAYLLSVRRFRMYIFKEPYFVCHLQGT